VGVEAGEGLRLIEAGQVDQEVANSEAHLRASRLAEAAISQQAILRGLELLLLRMEQAQGLAEKEPPAADKTLADLIKEQEQLRQETAQADLTKGEADKLVNRQAEIAKKIKPLVEATNVPPEMKKDLEAAHAAAKEATAQMFQQKREQALAEQEKTIAALKQADQKAEQLSAAPKPQVEASKLENARDELKKILAQQQKTSATAAEKPQQARHEEEQISAKLAEMPKRQPLPEELTKRVDEAKEATHQAAQRMEQAAPQRREATRQAEQAIERAVAQAEADAAEARMRELAAKMKPPEPAAKPTEQQQAERKNAADEMSRLAAKMHKALDEARQSVEMRIGERLDSVGKRLERLAEAEEKVAEAARSSNKRPGVPRPPRRPEWLTSWTKPPRPRSLKTWPGRWQSWPNRQRSRSLPRR